MSGIILSARMELVNGRAKFSASVAGQPALTVDYIPPVGDGQGYTSLELLLISMGTCLGTGVKSIIEHRLKKKVESLSVLATGQRRESHPTSFSRVTLSLRLSCPGLSGAELQGVIASAEKTICPVLDMVKGNTEVVVEPVLNGVAVDGKPDQERVRPEAASA